jgi:hypothetical protein
MGLYAELLSRVQRYMVGRPESLTTVREWLYSHADDLFDSEDEALRDLADIVWSRISDYEAGDIDEATLRAEIAREFPDLVTTPVVASDHTVATRSHAEIATGTAERAIVIEAEIDRPAGRPPLQRRSKFSVAPHQEVPSVSLSLAG